MQGMLRFGGLIVCVWLLLRAAVPAAAAQRMIAIASIFPVTDIVQQVGKEHWEITTLIPPGASAHTYEPTPDQVRQLSQARVFFRIGLGLEFWLEKLVRAAKSTGLVDVDLSKDIETLPTPSAELPSMPQISPGRGDTHRPRSSEQGQHDHLHEYEAPDVHYWLDPIRMRQVVTHIEQVFATLDPERARLYAERAKRLRADLDQLHTEISQRTRAFHHRRFIALHAAWTYFAPRYNLVQAAVVEPFPGREPSPRYLAELAQLMRREGVEAIVIEPQLTSAAARALARETGARVGILDPYGGQGIPGRESYLDLMRYNVAELEKLLD